MRRKCLFDPYFMLVLLALTTAPATAQELAPRAYWPAPIGTNVLTVGYQYSSGDVVTDPTLPVSGVDSNLNLVQLGYQRTFSLFGRTTNAQFNIPYTWGKSEGFREGNFLSVDTIGYGDLRARMSINLRGAPAMDPVAFRALMADPQTIVGVSLLVQAPTGTYDPDKILNTGANRWGVKPALGVIWPMYPTWALEAEIGGWFYSDNDDFLGATKEQDPIFSTEFHLVKRMKAGLWAALDVNYYVGGSTTVDSVELPDLQRNSRAGFTVFKPIKGMHALRASYSTGLAAESGGDYSVITLSYLAVW
jgi:hypothetical protein